MNRPYFILTCARSGSTSLARILDTATNGCCAVEPIPTLQRECRRALDGREHDPRHVVETLVAPRVRAGLTEQEHYGEKNVTYGPFVAALHEQLDARFVRLRRDGRDVVRSLLDWHDGLFGTIYRECIDPGTLSPAALAAAAALPVHLDTSDYARARPRPGSRWDAAWENLSRLEMCSFYWATMNHLHADAIAALPDADWIDLDYTGVTAADVIDVVRWLGLEGIDEDAVQAMLDRRVNSLADRGASGHRHPRWPDWDGGMRRRFEAIAGDTMTRLGYFNEHAIRWRPAGYGQCWEEKGADLAWYEWMHDGRRRVHESTVAWIRSQGFESVADFGCGLGVGYADALADRVYVGFEGNSKTVDWCRENRTNPRHAYHALDFIASPTPEQYDLVMSSGTIDNAWDVEAFLDAMLRASRQAIHVTCYRGWFPVLEEHRYSWSDKDGCFYSDVSPRRVREHLQRRGCRDVRIEPLATGRDDIPLETVITARVPAHVVHTPTPTIVTEVTA